MFVLFESSSGLALFKVQNDDKVKSVESISREFGSIDSAKKLLKMEKFVQFKDTNESLKVASSLLDGKLSKKVKSLLKKHISDADLKVDLAVNDSKLGSSIKEKLKINTFSDQRSLELMRGIRTYFTELVSDAKHNDENSMTLALAHSLSRYKLKFSPEKIDTMIVQSISLLDDIDKELNNYVMRCREWYSWHFPELATIVSDGIKYASLVSVIGLKENTANADFSKVNLSEEVVDQIKAAAEVSFGTQITEEDITNIKYLCDQIGELNSYRSDLTAYITSRMNTIAPNLSILVGEIVGARLIAHVGSLINLAKQPSSTIQILGAEKALFRALKAKKNTPKYGLIFHAPLVAQADSLFKGKISRSLAAKVALAARCDALTEETASAELDDQQKNLLPTKLAANNKAYLQAKLNKLETLRNNKVSGTGAFKAKVDKLKAKQFATSYNPAGDIALSADPQKKKSKKVDTKFQD